MRKWLLRTAAAAAAAPIALAAGAFGFAYSWDHGRARGVVPNYVSHLMCSATFVAGLDPAQFYAEAVAPMIWPTAPLANYTIDRGQRAVTSSFAGVATSRAVDRGALGCQVDHGASLSAVVAARPESAPLLPAIAGPDVVAPRDPALAAALGRAFAEPKKGPHRYTKAVVIVHDSHVIAERYAPGVGVATPLLGWSMTKSVTSALIGILVREHKLAVDQPAPVAAWSDPSDPRHAITIDNLLRMTSGLSIGQSLTSSWTSAFDPSAQMNFDIADEAGFAEQAHLADPPGTHWNYTNGNTALLSRMIRDAVGGDALSTYRFVHRELFDKLGMAHATLEFDGAGTPDGWGAMWAPARDWARFGLLYLNDGVVGGERILPEGWVAYSAQPTTVDDFYGYGSGFWTNRGAAKAAGWRVAAGMPADSFMARGTQGQYIVIAPREKLVIVRLGFAETPLGDIAAVERLVADTVAALAPAQHVSAR
jgi:CubicO group peptidase (beta-lactamase class C family)